MSIFLPTNEEIEKFTAEVKNHHTHHIGCPSSCFFGDDPEILEHESWIDEEGNANSKITIRARDHNI